MVRQLSEWTPSATRLVDEVSRDHLQKVCLVDGGAVVHEVKECIVGDAGIGGVVDAVARGVEQEEPGVVAVQTPHGMPARDVVSSKTVGKLRSPCVLIVGRFRAIFIEVDSDTGIEGFDGRPSVGGDLVVAMLV